jgi:hypothetical protein
MAKAVNEKTPDQIQEEQREENEVKHRKKREEEEKMKEKQRKRAERMERINPGHVDFPMSIEEAEEIEALLIDVPDEEITTEKIHEVVTKNMGEEKKKWILEQLEKRKNNGDIPELP